MPEQVRAGKVIQLRDALGTEADWRRAAAEAAQANARILAAQRADEVERARVEQAKAAAAAADREARARLARLRRAGVPARHLRVLLGLPDLEGVVVHYDPARPPARTVASWRRSKHATLVLGGAMGVGKSLAACWLIDQGPRRPYPHPDGYDLADWPDALRPRYVHAGQLARLSTYGRAGAASEVETLERCALLVIDEVGGVDVGQAATWIARLDALVSVRADNEMDTVLTTNLTAAEFAATYGERVLDRMRGDGRCWREFAGDSLRASDAWTEGAR